MTQNEIDDVSKKAYIIRTLDVTAFLTMILERAKQWKKDLTYGD